MSLRTEDFDYPLDASRIAQQPLERREDSRLLRLRRADGGIGHHRFTDLPDLLREGDLLVLNDTRVLPGRFFCRRRSGAKVEGLFLRERQTGRWEVLLKNAGRCRKGESLALGAAGAAELILRDRQGQGRWCVEVRPPAPAEDLLGRVGRTPLPPYIRRSEQASDEEDRRRYQTVYAARCGAVAAPTAGLHFTQELLDVLAARGIGRAFVTLHAGLGTFAPVKADRPAAHAMHEERYELSAAAAEAVNAACREGRRVVAVGTTSVRVLETAARQGLPLRASSGVTDLFLYPPAEFAVAGALITNFHLPRSTLLMLVAAFCSPGRTDGLGMILAAYAEAQRRGYRFYSYGDAMLIE